MDGEGQQVQAHQDRGEILFPVSEVVLKVVALVLQNVEGLVLDLPPGPATGGKFDDGIGTDRQIGDEAVAVGGLAASVDDLASRPGESNPQALLEPYVKLSLHTAPDAQPPTDGVERPYLVPGLLPSPVGPGPRLSNAAPSVQSHCRTFNPTTSRSAPVPRIGTQALAVFATWASPLTSGRQVLTFHTRAWSGFAPPICRMPLRQASGPPPS